MKILVLGDQPSISNLVARSLTSWGHEVSQKAIDRQSNDTESIDESATLLNRRRTLLKSVPDVVVCLTGPNPADALDVVEIFGNLVQRIVYCSSIQVYRAYGRWTNEEPGPPDLVPILEEDPLLKSSNWLSAEKALATASSAAITILRLPELYGPELPSPVVVEYLSQMDNEATAVSVGESVGEWRNALGFAPDVAHGVALAAKNSKAAGKTYNIADSFAFTQLDWIRAVGRAANWLGEVTLVPSTMGFDASKNYEQHIILDSSKIRQELGYQETTPINEALSSLVTSLRRQG